MLLRLMLLVPLIRHFMLLDVSRKLDGSEPHEGPLDTRLIDLIDQVRYAMDFGLIPLDKATPQHTEFTLPMRYRRGVTVVRRRTLGYWVSFTVDEGDKWKPGWSAKYYMSGNGEFAISFIGPNGQVSPLEIRSSVQVLREEKLWRTGLRSLLLEAS